MADQAINALSTKTTPETSDQLLLVGTGEPQLIDYDKLADAILNKITSKNYALDAGTMTLPAALNALNGKVKRFNVSAGKTTTLTYGNYATVSIIIIKNGIFIYSNGYLTEISNDKSVKAEISSNYKTITITNNMPKESAHGMAIFSDIIPGIVVE